MLFIRNFIIWFILLCILSHCGAAQLCTEEVLDNKRNTHIVVSSCENIGTFSIGVLRDNYWSGITYGYPQPWKGTFLSVRVGDSVYSTSPYLEGSELMDQYLDRGPLKIDNSIFISWNLPGNITVEERLRTADEGAVINITVINSNPEEKEIAIRLSLDTFLSGSDGGVFILGGERVQDTEMALSGNDIDFDYWEIKPNGVSAMGYFDKNRPDRFIISNWKKTIHQRGWDYQVDEGMEILTDSSVILMYEPKRINTGEGFSVDVRYALSNCFDKIKNNGESDVDCGGPCTTKCSLNQLCLSSQDCESGLICERGVCITHDIIRRYKSYITLFLIIFLILITIIGIIRIRRQREKPEEEERIIVQKSIKNDKASISIENKTRDEITDVVLSDFLPENAILKEIDPNSIVDGQHITWEIDKIKPNQRLVKNYKSSGFSEFLRFKFKSKKILKVIMECIK